MFQRVTSFGPLVCLACLLPLLADAQGPQCNKQQLDPNPPLCISAEPCEGRGKLGCALVESCSVTGRYPERPKTCVSGGGDNQHCEMVGGHAMDLCYTLKACIWDSTIPEDAQCKATSTICLLNYTDAYVDHLPCGHPT